MNISAEEKFNNEYEKYADMLYKIAFLHTGSKSESEDILQEIFIKLLYKSPEFKSEEHKKAWLIRATSNQCKDYLKSSRKRLLSLDDELIATYADNDNDTKIDVISKIIALDAKYKMPVYLYYYEGYNTQEIAECLHISQSAVKIRLKRARETLRKELEGYYEE